MFFYLMIILNLLRFTLLYFRLLYITLRQNIENARKLLDNGRRNCKKLTCDKRNKFLKYFQRIHSFLSSNR